MLRLLTRLCACLFIFACSEHDNVTPLRVAINPWPGYEYVYLAEQQGFFKEQGVAVSVLQFSSLSDARRAFERGQADGVGCTIIEMLQARELSPRLPQVVYVPDYSNGGDVLMAKSGIEKVTDLRGKRVGFEPGTLNLFMLTRALAKHGLTIADVVLVPMAQTAMQEALSKNEVEAVVTYPPVSIAIANASLGTTVFSTKEIPGEVLDIIMFDQSVLQSRPDDVRKFIKGLEKAFQFAEKNPETAYALMAERERISVEDFRAAVEQDLYIIKAHEQSEYFKPEGKLMTAIAGVQTVLKQNGEISAEFPPSSFLPETFFIQGQ